MTSIRRWVALMVATVAIPACGGGGGGGGAAPPPAAPSSAPGGFGATWGDSQVALAWAAVADATSYNVYQATLTGGPYTLVTNVVVLNHTVTGLTNGTTYFFIVRAANGGGESGDSGEVSGAPATVPAAPGSPSAVPGDAQITVSWAAVGGTTGYRVERSLTTGGPYAPVTTLAATSHVDAPLANGTTYFFVIRGINGSVVGPASAEVSATPAVATTFNHARGADYQVWAVAAAADVTGDVYIGGELRSFAGQAIGGVCRLNSNGSYDSGFVMGTGTRTGHVRAIAPLANGAVYIGGEFGEYNLTSVNRIVRLNSDGTIDGGFAIGTGFNGQVNVITPDGSGNIYVGGSFTSYNGTTANRIVRLTSAGAIDATFVSGTAFSAVGSYVQAITVDGSGNVVVGGQFSTYNLTGVSNIVRLTSAGAVDGTFTATSGGPVNAVVVAGDASGDLYVGGTFSTFNAAAQSRIVRVTSTGTTVASFVAAGSFNSDVNRLVASGTGIYVGGLFTSYKGTAVGRVTRLDNTGTIDAAFATGTGFNSDVQTIAPDGSGGVLVGGLFTAYNGVGIDRAARLNASGALVNLPTGAGFSHPVNAVAFVPSSTDVYVGGQFTHYDGSARRGLVRLNSDGTLDPTLSIGQGFVGSVNALAVAGDGDLYVAGGISWYDGTTLSRIVRLNPDGTIDAGFVTGTGFDGAVWALAMAPGLSGDIYVAGQFTSWKGTPVNRVVRLDSSGAIVAFTAGTGFDGAVFALAIDGSGNVVAGGDFAAYNGTASVRIARLGSTGTIDAAFATATGTGFDGVVNGVAIDGSGDIYVAGGFGQFNGGTANRVARLNPDGSVDPAFITGTGFNGIASALAVAPGSDVYVGGNFSSYKTSPVRPLIRLNSDGSVDGGFPASIPATTYAPGAVSVIALVPDASGRLYMGGNITTWVGTTFDFFGRLTPAGAVE